MITFLYIVGTYLAIGIALYLYAVVKNFEVMDVWDWKIKDGYIGVIRISKPFMFWLEYLLKRKN